MGRCPWKRPSDRFFGAGAACTQQERLIRAGPKGGGAQRILWGLTQGVGGRISLVPGTGTPMPGEGGEWVRLKGFEDANTVQN
jgi:hypothetical protein